MKANEIFRCEISRNIGHIKVKQLSIRKLLSEITNKLFFLKWQQFELYKNMHLYSLLKGDCVVNELFLRQYWEKSYES